MADLARERRFHFHEVYSPEAEAMHRLALTYDKLRKNRQQHRARLRALIEGVFPELLKVLPLDSLWARHLLERHLLPEDFLQLDIDREAVMDVSRNQHGQETLLQLQTLARHTIGIPMSEIERQIQRLSARAWLRLIDVTEAQIRDVAANLSASPSRRPTTLRS